VAEVEMDVLPDIEPCRQAVRSAQRGGCTVGLVPTMGALHEGHLSLVRAARSQCDFVAVTIFVNPTQFGPGEDLDQYPRTWDADLALCESVGVDLIFAPQARTMYPEASSTSVRVSGVTEGLCGAWRPGHFEGVATIVAKLFMVLPADRAFFGEKDYQQLIVIRRMVRDLMIPVEIVPCPTVREPDGLAMSSRNAYLSRDERIQVTSLSRALLAAAKRVRAGQRDAERLTSLVRSEILAAGPATIEYVDAVDAETLEVLSVIDRPARLCLAVRIGSCRLIDNVELAVE
jgi:pantoate--beta-alanine ligase